jgi:choline dehydrogenase-like flavoprotein
VRGTKADFDDWNMPGWSGDEVFSYMAKSETFHGKPWFDADDLSHGKNGPLHTEPHDPAPISALMIKAYQETAGLQYKPDMFSTGDLAEGCGWTTRSVYKGLRSCAADFVADRAKWKNLHIVTDVTVGKVVFENENGRPRAQSVQVVSKDGAMKSYHARKEIIVAGGSYGSPAILLRSGIGPTAELAALEIETIHNLGGVGKNLQDHTMVGQNYEINDPSLTRDRDLYAEGAMEKALKTWQETRGGILAGFPLGAFAFARMDDRLADSPLWRKPTDTSRDPMGQTLKQPTVEFYQTESYVLAGPEHMSDFPKNGQAAIAMFTILFGQQSRGEVTLRSRDPMESPKVDHKYFDNPLDVLVLAEGARYANEIALNSSATGRFIQGSWPRDALHHKMQTRQEWVEYVKANAFTGL